MNDEHRLSDMVDFGPWYPLRDQKSKEGKQRLISPFDPAPVADILCQGLGHSGKSQQSDDYTPSEEEILNYARRVNLLDKHLDELEKFVNLGRDLRWIIHRIARASRLNDRYPWTATRVTMCVDGHYDLRLHVNENLLATSKTENWSRTQYYGKIRVTSVTDIFNVLKVIESRVNSGDWIVYINCEFHLLEMVKFHFFQPQRARVELQQMGERQGEERED